MCLYLDFFKKLTNLSKGSCPSFRACTTAARCIVLWCAVFSPSQLIAVLNTHWHSNPIALRSFLVEFCTADVFDCCVVCHPLPKHYWSAECHAIVVNGLLIFVVTHRFLVDPLFIKLKTPEAKRATKFTAPLCNLIEMITCHGLADPLSNGKSRIKLIDWGPFRFEDYFDLAP